ncbi:hypothetical protein KBTX_00621 [wastewater metagenome]|uniref:Citrate transporter-like domain-containing protein n=3 Tax=root TaxID=1 RepID=A0A5B8R8M1_9ZZZZ|nr:hypothetical protein KBTEX_00621 [uncultured organism]
MEGRRIRAQARRRRRRGVAGTALGLAMASAGVHAFVPVVPIALAGVLTWLAGGLLWPDVAPRTRRQVLALLVAGSAGLVWAAANGEPLAWGRALAGNAALIGMLSAVGFLRLIAAPAGGGEERLPSGRRGVVGTLLGLHLFGAVVNLSTVFIMAHRMVRDGRLDDRQLRVLTRGFPAAAFWSPFFAAMAAALTYAPGAHLTPLLMVGVPLAAVALAVTAVELAREPLGDFRGYPLHWGSLWLPGVLAAIILAGHWWDPTLSVLGMITVLAPLLTAAVLPFRDPAPVRLLSRQVVARLPLMANELGLFLAAGMLAAGLEGVVATLGGWVPFAHFGGLQAGVVLALMVAVSLVGVHPVIGIAAFGTLLAPLSPDPSLLAMTFLAGWGIGVAVSPLSGLNLALQGAYDVAPARVVRLNWRYGVVMVAASTVAFVLYARLVPG